MVPDKSGRILVVGQDAKLRRLISTVIATSGYPRPTEHEGPGLREILDRFDLREFILVILDLHSGGSKEKPLSYEAIPCRTLVLMHERGEESASSCPGAQILRKPFNLGEFKAALQNVMPSPPSLTHRAICAASATESVQSACDISGEDGCPNCGLGRSVLGGGTFAEAKVGGDLVPKNVLPKQEEFNGEVAKIAASHGTVLLLGESGSGKDVIARRIHDLSPRAGGPFVPVNCAALTPTLMESELFGHERGAFTGATHRRIGMIEAARGGTLFLDEIGDMPFEFQAKLNRFLENREFTPLGSDRMRLADVRIIAATNADLEKLMEEGRFRGDLFYRLNVLEMWVPPLRERPEDIPALIGRFAAEVALRDRRPVPCFTREAIEALKQSPWRGNVRELRGAVERIVVQSCGAQVDWGDLPQKYRVSRGVLPEARSARVNYRVSITKDRVLRALEEAGKNIPLAAQLLGVGRQHVYTLKKKFGIE